MKCRLKFPETARVLPPEILLERDFHCLALMLAAELFWGFLVMSPMITTPPFCGTSIFRCLPHLWDAATPRETGASSGSLCEWSL